MNTTNFLSLTMHKVIRSSNLSLNVGASDDGSIRDISPFIACIDGGILGMCV